MKLLLYSHYFAPSIGGVENIVKQLASGLAARRSSDRTSEFQVVLATEIPARDFDDSTLPFRIVREPGVFRLFKLIRDSDLVHIAGAAFLPLFLARLMGKP